MKTDNIFYDKDFRNKIIHADAKELKQLIADVSAGVQVKVVINSKGTIYFAIPHASALGFIDLSDIQAAAKVGTTGCVGSVASASTFGSICGSFTSIASASTLGTAGTAK